MVAIRSPFYTDNPRLQDDASRRNDALGDFFLRGRRINLSSGGDKAEPTPGNGLYLPPTNLNPATDPEAWQNAYNAIIQGNIGYTPIVPGQYYPGMIAGGGQASPNVNVTQPGHAYTPFNYSAFGAPAAMGGGLGLLGG